MGFFVKVVAFRTASSMPSPTNERNNRSQSIRSSQLLLQANGTVRLRQHGSHQSLPAGSSPANRQSNLSNITVRDFSCRIGDRVTRSGSSAQIRFSRSNVNILHFGPSPMHVPSGGPPIAQRTLGLGPAPPPGWLGQCRLQYFADEARVRHAPRLRATLHRLHQSGRQPHIVSSQSNPETSLSSTYLKMYECTYSCKRLCGSH